MNSRQRESRVHRRCQITKIISGGQTGVDQAALEAARECGLATGGWMPFGFKTLSGLRPDMESLYGMREHESTTYPPRTEANVMDADATLCIATELDSTGEQCTRRFIKQHRKPHFIVHLDKLGYSETETCRVDLSWVEPIVSWVRLVNPRIINVAGNSEQTSGMIQARAKKLLVEVFMALNIGKFAPAPPVRIVDVQVPEVDEAFLEIIKNKPAVSEQDLRDMLKFVAAEESAKQDLRDGVPPKSEFIKRLEERIQ